MTTQRTASNSEARKRLEERARTDEYTPTTQQVREAYQVAHEVTGAPVDPAQFDRWLAAHDAEVAAKAWDEGARAAGRYGHEDGWTSDMNPFAGNPYRAHRDQP